MKKNQIYPRYFDSKLRVDTFTLLLKMWHHLAPKHTQLANPWMNLSPVNRHQLTDLISFHNCNDRLQLANQKPNTNCITSQVEYLQCRNSKASHQKLHAYKCEYLSFQTVYGREILRVYFYSPSRCAGKVLSKSEIWLKIWLEGL